MQTQNMNVILYCRKWGETVAFYRDTLGFPPKTATDWLVEFEVAPHACLSVADETRTSIRAAGGAAITMTFRVADVRRMWQMLNQTRVKTEPIRDCRLGGQAFFLRDPEGHRLEFWSESGNE